MVRPLREPLRSPHGRADPQGGCDHRRGAGPGRRRMPPAGRRAHQPDGQAPDRSLDLARRRGPRAEGARRHGRSRDEPPLDPGLQAGGERAGRAERRRPADGAPDRRRDGGRRGHPLLGGRSGAPAAGMSAGPAVRCAVRAGSYYDSVVLMQLQRALAALQGVLDAGVMMATPANRELLAASGLLPDGGITAGPHDLLIAIKAETDAAAGEALARVYALLQARPSAAGNGEQDFRPRGLASALKSLPEACWVLISVPGRHAAAVAEEAIDQGRNVFLYSDNVPVEREVALKRKARERGLLVLGPDCGTAVVGGVGFGFANRVRRGPVGLIGASGTGLQAVMSHLHALGSGISQAIGTGGRDLAAEVGGITALPAPDLLRRAPRTPA